MFERHVDRLLSKIENERLRRLIKGAGRFYVGYLGRSLYFLLGVQVVVTVLVDMVNRRMP